MEELRRRCEVKCRDLKSEIRGLNDMKIESAKDLRVYQKAYALAMELFELSKEFPNEERYVYPVK